MNEKYRNFKKEILNFYEIQGRHDLPWRKNITPYRIVVSEIMLQQTQVDRVIPFFKKWMREFPSWRALSRAPQSHILKTWKGLGYNSRALRLQKLAILVVDKYGGKLPKNFKKLVQLPGIGPYTAGAIRAFVWNLYTPIIETNIRRVFIYHFFKNKENISDDEIFHIMEEFKHIQDVRKWYYALMDYGAVLSKTLNFNPNKQSKHYYKQSIFNGSDRQIRGKILEVLLKQKEHTILEQTLIEKIKNTYQQLDIPRARVQKIIFELEKEGFLHKQKKNIILR